jgi:cellulose synthase/poly-beta-1,6-N-acetylglucosamine synthase-like glycosyltransferase
MSVKLPPVTQLETAPARRGPPSLPAMPSASPLRFAIAIAVGTGVFVASLYGLVLGSPRVLLGVTAGYLGYELLLSVGLGLAAVAGIRSWRRAQALDCPTSEDALPTLAVLIAAHNERLSIVETLSSLAAQRGVRFEVLVASDGSTDGMNALLVERCALSRVPGDLVTYAGEPGFPLRLLTLPKRGKGAALNAALGRTDAEVVVTLDADTTLGPDALLSMARAFTDARVQAASGFVYVRNAATAGWLTRYQFTEYVRNFLWRIGLAHLGVNLQVSGAFGGLRAETVRRLGGFSVDSLVEDYEVLFRLHQRLLEEGRDYRVLALPSAAAFTDGPSRLGGFVHQRARWFTGFLQTLWDYRGMIANPRYGRVGWLMLPVKSIDAALPFWGFTTLAILLGAVASGRTELRAWTLTLLGAKWLLDAALFAAMLRWHRQAFPLQSERLSFAWQLFCGCTESLGFNWLRQVAVLRAYGWCFRRLRPWKQARWLEGPSGLPAANDSDPAPQAQTGS